jgi:chromate transporter
MKNISLFDISKTFFKIGITCWGGPAIVAYIKKEIVEKKKWLRDDEFKESLGFCQMFPGAIAVQTSAHIGYRIKGTLGSLFAFFFYTLPTFLLILFLSFIYFKYEKVPSFIKLFEYLDSVIVAIIVEAIWSMRKLAEQNFKGALLILLSAVAFILNGEVVLILLVAGVLGVLLFEKKGEQKIELKTIFGYLKKLSFFPLVLFVFLLAIFFLFGNISPDIKELCFRMVKVNLLAFGGGYTAVALMFQESVIATEWLTESEFVNGLALGQITPGPVIITATFIGYKIGGFTGAVLSTIAVLFPSYLILLFLSPLFKEISQMPFVKPFTAGLVCAFIGMLFQLLFHLSAKGATDLLSVLVIIASFVLLRLKVSPIVLVLLSAILSILIG